MASPTQIVLQLDWTVAKQHIHMHTSCTLACWASLRQPTPGVSNLFFLWELIWQSEFGQELHMFCNVWEIFIHIAAQLSTQTSWISIFCVNSNKMLISDTHILYENTLNSAAFSVGQAHTIKFTSYKCHSQQNNVLLILLVLSFCLFTYHYNKSLPFTFPSSSKVHMHVFHSFILSFIWLALHLRCMLSFSIQVHSCVVIYRFDDIHVITSEKLLHDCK